MEEQQVQFNLLQERTDVGIADLTEINNQLQDMLDDKNMEIELMRKSPTQPLSYPTGGLFDETTDMHMVVPHSQRRRKKNIDVQDSQAIQTKRNVMSNFLERSDPSM